MVTARYKKMDGFLMVEHAMNGRCSGLQWVWNMNNAMIVEESSYKKGEEHGITRTWHPNGKLRTERYSFRGKAEGLSRKYHLNGMTLRETFWLHGYKHGIERYWDVSGKLYKETLFYKGAGSDIKGSTEVKRVDDPFYGDSSIECDETKANSLLEFAQNAVEVELKELPQQSYYEAAKAASAALRIKLWVCDATDHNNIRNALLGLSGTN